MDSSIRTQFYTRWLTIGDECKARESSVPAIKGSGEKGLPSEYLWWIRGEDTGRDDRTLCHALLRTVRSTRP